MPQGNPVLIPAADIVALSRAVESLISRGEEDLYVDVRPGVAELRDSRGGSYGVRKWE